MKSIRTFSVSSLLKGEEIKQLYLKELKAYKPAATVSANLPETFGTPSAPAKPAYDLTAGKEAAPIAPKKTVEAFAAPAYKPIEYNDAFFKEEGDEDLDPVDKKAKFDILNKYHEWQRTVQAKADYKAKEVEREAAADMFSGLDWPQLQDPIDDPKNVPNFVDIDVDNHPNRLFPKPLREIDYDHHH